MTPCQMKEANSQRKNCPCICPRVPINPFVKSVIHANLLLRSSANTAEIAKTSVTVSQRDHSYFCQERQENPGGINLTYKDKMQYHDKARRSQCQL